MEAMRQVERQEKLHTLYVHAGHFITTEKQLDEVVDKVFDNTRQFSSDARPGLNIWNLGYPESVNELLSKANMNPGTQKAMEVAEGSQPVMRERMKRLSEELTGGKMEGGR